MIVTFSGKCATFRAAGRSLPCRAVKYFHGQGGRAYFTIAIDDPTDKGHIGRRIQLPWVRQFVPRAPHSLWYLEKLTNPIAGPPDRKQLVYPMFFARAATLQAILRHEKRVFNPDRKDTHWGKRKLKRDQ